MAIKSSKTTQSAEPFGFDVTCVIGRVIEDPKADLSMHEQAMLLVARHESDGHYTWPMPDGGTYHVTVEHEQAKTNGAVAEEDDYRY